MKELENNHSAMKGRLVQEVTRLGHELQFKKIPIVLLGVLLQRAGGWNIRLGLGSY
jgi:hypothetical protein